MARTSITGKQFDEERALYHLQNAVIRGDAVMECTGEIILRTETEKKAV